MVTNFLDDFLMVAPTEVACNHLVSTFISVCNRIGLQVAEEKMEWATPRLIFLGVLMIGDRFLFSIPEDKQLRAVNMTRLMIDKKKVTIYELQQYTGFLNFLCKAIFLGRAFTRRMYDQIPWVTKQGVKLKQHHHVRLDSEFKADCWVWADFLDKKIPWSICRPFIDFSLETLATDLGLYTDSSANPKLGFRGWFRTRWFAQVWDPGFIDLCKASIEYLELYALTVAITLWGPGLSNLRVVIFTDNTGSRDVLNSNSSK